MNKIIFLLFLVFPTFAFGQSFEGNYRAIFFNPFSEPKTIITEFEVNTDNSISGKIKIDTTIKAFTGTLDKKGKFEAVIEQVGKFTYKLKGKFDKNNKISLVQRNQVGSGMNKNVSESSLEGTFAKFVKPADKIETTFPPTLVELIDSGKNWIKIQHSNPLFGTEWTEISAEISFGSSAKNMAGVKADSADYFNLVLKSKTEGQQRLSISTRNYSQTQKSWKAADLRYISYREENESTRNSFSAGDTMQTDPFFADGILEIVKETGTQIIFKLSNFKIKRFAKQDFVVLNGFIYADK